MNTSTFTVSGMTCGNCVKHVTTEVQKIPGVTAVDITLETGVVVVSAESEIVNSKFESAVIDAGYEMVKSQ